MFKNSKLSRFLSGLKGGTPFQLQFKDRVGAGSVLATILKGSFKNLSNNKENVIVLGIPRGGVIVADVVARKLSADFDVILSRKLTAPDNKENAIGAIMPEGYTYLDEFLVNSLQVSQDYIEKEKSNQLKEIKRRTSLYRPKKLPTQYTIKDRTVILVDDGIATGATAIVAARWIRSQQPRRLIIAAPVSQPQTIDILKQEADAVEVITTPSNFGSVSQFYANFDVVTDERVIQIIRDRNLLPSPQ